MLHFAECVAVVCATRGQVVLGEDEFGAVSRLDAHVVVVVFGDEKLEVVRAVFQFCKLGHEVGGGVFCVEGAVVAELDELTGTGFFVGEVDFQAVEADVGAGQGGRGQGGHVGGVGGGADAGCDGGALPCQDVQHLFTGGRVFDHSGVVGVGVEEGGAGVAGRGGAEQGDGAVAFGVDVFEVVPGEEVFHDPVVVGGDGVFGVADDVVLLDARVAAVPLAVTGVRLADEGLVGVFGGQLGVGVVGLVAPDVDVFVGRAAVEGLEFVFIGLGRGELVDGRSVLGDDFARAFHDDRDAEVVAAEGDGFRREGRAEERGADGDHLVEFALLGGVVQQVVFEDEAAHGVCDGLDVGCAGCGEGLVDFVRDERGVAAVVEPPVIRETEEGFAGDVAGLFQVVDEGVVVGRHAEFVVGEVGDAFQAVVIGVDGDGDVGVFLHDVRAARAGRGERHVVAERGVDQQGVPDVKPGQVAVGVQL